MTSTSPGVAALVASLLLAAPGAACNGTSPPTPTRPQDMPSSHEIQDWMKLRDLSADELQRALGLAVDTQAPDRSYGGLSPVMTWHDPRHHPAHFLFQAGAQVLLYVDDEAALARLDVDSLRASLGAPDAQLRSRAGKRPLLSVYASRGLAFAADDRRVYYVEVFPPTTLDDYRTHIYVEPPVYRR